MRNLNDEKTSEHVSDDAIASATTNSSSSITISNTTADSVNLGEQLKRTKSKSKKTPEKPKKARVNREILTTLLSRKKLYKILMHKLDM